ncbi:MAG: spore germination protein [Thermoflavifilum sp.]|nr:spore germination protein [Thermoflavifilum sp.]MCL6514402.1 spore germination protein [Alicyclobacillus sp.]
MPRQRFMRSTHLLLNKVQTAYDVVIRAIPGSEMDLVYVSSIVDVTRLEERLLRPLLERPPKANHHLLSWARKTIQIGEVDFTESHDEAVKKLLDGHAILCVRGGYVIANVQGAQRRVPEEPAAEMSLRGPRDGFTESLDTNISLIRTRLRDAQVVFRTFEFGTRTKTKVLLIYIEDLANPNIVKEAVQRLQAVQLDGLLESGNLEQWIEDNPWSPYPQIQSTERPDKTVSALLEGRLAILVDGSPFALLIPSVMISFFQTSDDYSQRWIPGSVIRTVRSFALVLSIFSPSLYIAFTMYNPELIPANLLIQLAATREGIPLPIVFEAMFMEFMVELVREAGNRMPQQMGQSFTVVGGLVLGDIAVRAGIVSPMMVVVVGLTALGAFAIPNYEAAFVTRMIRFPMLMVTSLFGVVGTLWFTLIVFAHLSSLKSFGVPYLTPFAQAAYPDWLDTFWRAPAQRSILRPATYWSLNSWARRRRMARRRR